MNNGHLHELLADRVAEDLRRCGFKIRPDAAVPGGFVDRLAGRGRITLAVEVERKPDRVVQDVLKAEAIGADLLIVCPTPRTVAAARRKLDRSGLAPHTHFRGFRGRKAIRVWVLTPGAARAWVYERFRV